MVGCFFKNAERPFIGSVLTHISRIILDNKNADFSYRLGKNQLKNMSACSFVLMFVIHFDRFCISYKFVNISLPKYKLSNLPSPFKYSETFFSFSGNIGHVVIRVPATI